MSSFEPLELMKLHKVYQIYSICAQQNGDVQDFDTRWDQALLPPSGKGTENVLEGLNKLKIRDAVQLQTVLAMNDHEMPKLSKIEDYGEKTH